MPDDTTGDSSSDESGEARRQWERDRTTFQRVYDVMTGVTEHASASEIAERAACSPDGARNALTQLVEMGIADRRGSRPTEYRRNESYFEWKRVETLADDHTAATLRERLDDLLAEDADLQESFGVPNPDAASVASVESGDHAALHDRLESLSRWRTVRHDIELLQRAVSRAETRGRDGTDLRGSA